MDLLDDYLAGVRAHGAVFCNAVSTPPWGLRFTEPAPLALGAMLRGDAWLVPDEGAAVPLRQGDVALIRTRLPYTVADRPESAPRVLVDGADRCVLTGDPADSGRNWRVTGRTVGDGGPGAGSASGAGSGSASGSASGGAEDGLASGASASGSGGPGGGSGGGSDLLITAGYRVGGELCAPLLDALPAIAVVRPEPGLASLLDLIAAEVEHDEPGQQVVLDRFLDLLLVRVLRSWFARSDTTPPTGYRALADPDIGHVLRRLHEDPARPWTVASLADEAGMSRTVFARRFSALVGKPPLTYLTDWRMTLAADRLRAPGATITAVARGVGYADGFAFSAAFKRVRGISPSAHRASGRELPATRAL
ncbi:AraC family transcriptional regulator [Streptomyces jumonjinensis]|uniref:AraC family transcriptional regulator n=1 Tax=Streptomyces jumonjinensis TaxID=1945 RepID=UPI002B1F202C|nr:AraC family transcriptional regulator [Streptomyces jumonjinensis]